LPLPTINESEQKMGKGAVMVVEVVVVVVVVVVEEAVFIRDNRGGFLYDGEVVFTRDHSGGCAVKVHQYLNVLLYQVCANACT